MKDRKKSLDRRDFLVGTASMAVVAGTGLVGCSDNSDPSSDMGGNDLGKDSGADGSGACNATPTALQPITKAAKVVEVHDPKCVDKSSYNDVRIKAMVLAGLKELGGNPDIKQAWRALIPDFSPSMRIGLKLNMLSDKLYNYRGMLEALIETLVDDLGASADRIWIWDRRTDELTRTKLPSTLKGAKVAGTITSFTDHSGPGYETKGSCVIDKETHLSKILTQQTDITINLPVLKTHNISSITGALKSTYGMIDNPLDYHTNLNQYMPAIYRLDQIHKSLRLHITEAFKGVVKGGPTSYPDTIQGRLIFSRDPVALDSHIVNLVNSIRAGMNLPPVNATKLKWIDEAVKLNLGTSQITAKTIEMS